MNDEELAIISQWFSFSNEEFSQARSIQNLLNIGTIIVTKGGSGAFVIDKGKLFQSPGITVQVKDTIGSGDAFLAAFLSKHLFDEMPSESLKFACKIGALVASKKGGTPNISLEEILKI